MEKDNTRLIKTYEDRLKKTKKKRDDGEKPPKGEASYAQQIKGLNNEIKQLKAENKKVATAKTGISSLDGEKNAVKRMNAKLRTNLQTGEGRTKKEGVPPVSYANRGPQPEPRTVKEMKATPLQSKSTAKPGPGEMSNEKSKEKVKDTTIDKSAATKEEGIGARIARKLGDKRSEEEMIKTRKMNEEDEKEMGMNKGGMAGKKVYGMREGGFTKRGGMYKKGY
jgi:hypothetical protein